MTAALTDQIKEMVAENQHLRVKSENDDTTLHLMRQQYDALADSVDAMRDEHAREVHLLRTQRDQAVIKHSRIKALLMQSTEIIMQALRADQGNETPEKMPVATLAIVHDDRLPAVGMSN